MTYRIEYRPKSSRIWLVWATVEGADNARAEKRAAEARADVAEVRVLKQTWVPVNLNHEKH